jgi:8-oxo-(d)GTP phosphatase
MSSNKPGSRLIKAAGGVAWRPGPDGEPEILLVHRKKYDDWSLPKGKTEPGEALPVTAVREVLEEGGVQLALGRRLNSVRYSVGGRPKRVHYWAARVLSVDARAVPNHEVDEVTWLPARRAVDKVSYAHDHGVLADFAARPVGTVPLILARHSKALDKNGWRRADAIRPLAGEGRADARALADLLACFAPRRLISSTAVRCTDTLRPLARLMGVPLRAEPALYVHSQPSRTGGADPETDLESLVREVIAAGEPTVLCAHRENIPELRRAALAVLAGHPGRPAPACADGAPPGSPPALAGLAELPPDWDDPLPTSGFWVLNIAPLPPEQSAGVAGSAGVPGSARGTASAEVPGSAGVAGVAGLAGGSGASGSAAARPARRASRWWRGWARRPVSGPSGIRARVPDDVAASAGVPLDGPDDTQPPGADRPVGLLVSADRYDLTEC